LKEYRSKGEQKMTVQHVRVAEGGQAIVGNVDAPAEGGRGARKKWRSTPCTWICTGHCDATRNQSGAGCRAELSMPNARGWRLGSQGQQERREARRDDRRVTCA
jgi:hypothetical protein